MGYGVTVYQFLKIFNRKFVELAPMYPAYQTNETLSIDVPHGFATDEVSILYAVDGQMRNCATYIEIKPDTIAITFDPTYRFIINIPLVEYDGDVVIEPWLDELEGAVRTRLKVKYEMTTKEFNDLHSELKLEVT